MRRYVAPTRRGLTFLEFILALAITAMVGLAITGMLTSVAMGQRLRRDTRAFVIRTHALKSRLCAYIGPSRSFLRNNGTDLVLWLEDSRQSGTVHASEIRWLIYDDSAGTGRYIGVEDFKSAGRKALQVRVLPRAPFVGKGLGLVFDSRP